MLSVSGCGALEYLQEGKPTYYFVDTVRVQVPPSDLKGPGPFSDEDVGLGRAEHHYRLDRLLFTVFGPVVMLWVFAYVCVFVFRWIAAGFKKNGT